MLKPCEIIHVKKANGWKWRSLTQPGAAKAKMSKEIRALFRLRVGSAGAWLQPAGQVPTKKAQQG